MEPHGGDILRTRPDPGPSPGWQVKEEGRRTPLHIVNLVAKSDTWSALENADLPNQSRPKMLLRLVELSKRVPAGVYLADILDLLGAGVAELQVIGAEQEASQQRALKAL